MDRKLTDSIKVYYILIVNGLNLETGLDEWPVFGRTGRPGQFLKHCVKIHPEPVLFHPGWVNIIGTQVEVPSRYANHRVTRRARDARVGNSSEKLDSTGHLSGMPRRDSSRKMTDRTGCREHERIRYEFCRLRRSRCLFSFQADRDGRGLSSPGRNGPKL